MPETNEEKSRAGDARRETAHRRHWRSEELFHAVQEITIEHHGEIYRLRITRNDKLILTK